MRARVNGEIERAKSKGATPQNLAIKYAVVWEKIGRSWKLSQDIWNTDK